MNRYGLGSKLCLVSLNSLILSFLLVFASGQLSCWLYHIVQPSRDDMTSIFLVLAFVFRPYSLKECYKVDGRAWWQIISYGPSAPICLSSPNIGSRSMQKSAGLLSTIELHFQRIRSLHSPVVPVHWSMGLSWRPLALLIHLYFLPSVSRKDSIFLTSRVQYSVTWPKNFLKYFREPNLK